MSTEDKHGVVRSENDKRLEVRPEVKLEVRLEVRVEAGG